ncbi:diacylglycerol/lipid kinase family protein [Ornithinimicrobium sufpigmenti]|uniref:diacylglycerol/lipid kinase family protein n=1 Tax=Ornithinimicrobium sufpigmenti TaxID=2508882 RepID=UPI00103640BA|nr:MULTISPECIES: diacylglycerol kinase family protein [unclassified Ornithinimicrobium]
MRYAVAHGRRRRGPGGSGARVGEQAVDALRAAGHEVTEVVAGSLAQARAACASLVADGIDVLVAVGGDGVVSMAADLCADTSTAVAILPAGTGNDNARSLGIRRGAHALEVLLADGRRRVDTLHLPELDRHVLSSVTSALDARISDRANRWPRVLGGMTYTLSALVEIALLRRQPPLHYVLTVDGAPQALETLVVVPANMPYVGGGLHICPEADPADGLLDLVVIRPVPPSQAVQLLRAVRAGRLAEHPAVSVTRARQVRIEGPADIVAQGDGEPLAPLPLTVQVVPSILRVVAPALT